MNKLGPDEVRRVKLLAVAMRDAFRLSVELGDEHGAAFFGEIQDALGLKPKTHKPQLKPGVRYTGKDTNR